MAMFLCLRIYLALIFLVPIVTSELRTHDHTFQPDYVLRISEEVFPVACVTRPTVLVNGTSPGPIIYLRENETSWVRVYNDLETKNTTVHWHGLSQSLAPFSDGTPVASQWPIKAGEFFDYEIKPLIGEAGTYFYHSHVEFQAVSAAGPLIVEEIDEAAPYSYDDERIMFISELYNRTDEMVVTGVLQPPSNYTWSGEPSTILVNGNSFRGLDANDSQTPEPWYIPDPSLASTCGPEVIQVDPGKTYRFRVVGGTALNLVAIGFEDHPELSVIAADAQYTQPANTDRIQVGAGQRFDFLLHTKTEDELRTLGKSNFWIQLESRYRPVNVTSYAVLSYTQKPPNQTTALAPPQDRPLTFTNQIYDWLEYTLEPLVPNGFPTADKVTRQVFLTSDELIAKNGIYASVENHTWTEINQHRGNTSFSDRLVPVPNSPYLVDIYKYGDAAIPDYELAVQQYDGWDPNLNVYPAKVGEVIDIILINQPDGFAFGFDIHPWHIHGGHIYDLGSGPGTYNATANEERLAGYNPVLRDTTMLYKFVDDQLAGENKNYTSQGWRAWRLNVTTPGVWMVHCHILQHMIMGMQSVWVMGNASEITRGMSSGYVQGYLDYGGDAYGNASYDPLVNHYF